jgi:hypothetical protein
MKKHFVMILTAIMTTLMLAACLGLKTEIDIKRNGNGTINMEYRISEELFSMGALSGNENSPPVPVGKKDFEQTFNRIPGIEMTSYSEKEDENDRIFLIKSKFDNLEALANLLDSQGRQVVVEHKNGKTFLTVSFDINDEDIDPDFIAILPIVFEDYYMDFTITLPNNCEVSYIGADGNALSAMPYGETTVTAKSVDFYSSMGDLFTETETSAMVISW